MEGSCIQYCLPESNTVQLTKRYSGSVTLELRRWGPKSTVCALKWTVLGITPVQNERERQRRCLGMLCRKHMRTLPARSCLRLEIRSKGTANWSARLAHSERVTAQAPVADDAQRAVRVLTHEHPL